jgi:hypothetical protein
MEEKFGGLIVPKNGRACTQHGVLTNQLADMDGPNVRRRQPRPRYAGAEDKLIVETRQHMEEQFTVLGDQIRVLTTQFSNMGGHNGDDLETLLRSAERTDVSTMRKLMPINGEMDSNSIFHNAKGIYNPKNF